MVTGLTFSSAFALTPQENINLSQTPNQPIQERRTTLEVGGQHYNLTGNQAAWDGAYVRGSWKQNSKNVWNYEIVPTKRFNESGLFYSATLTRNFDANNYASLALGSSQGGSYFPKLRVDAFMHHKLLEKRNLVINLGTTYYKAKDTHNDQTLHMGGTYYFEKPWIVETEWTHNNSKPGNIKANYVSTAITYGKNKEGMLTVRYGKGKEAYQAIGESQTISSFYSNILSVNYRYWLADDMGVNMTAENYKNYLYKRRGVDVGFFKEF